MANLTLIEAMAKTADLVYQKVKTLISQSGGGSITLNTKTETAIGTFDGETIYRQVFEGQGTSPSRDFKIFTDFSKIVKLEFFVFIGAVVAVNLSNYIKIENGKISTTSDYPSKYSDPEFKYICIFEYVK